MRSKRKVLKIDSVSQEDFFGSEAHFEKIVDDGGADFHDGDRVMRNGFAAR